MLALAAFPLSAEIVEEGSWKLDISDNHGMTTVYKDNVAIIPQNYAVFKLDDTEYSLDKDLTFFGVDITADYTDSFGSGQRVDLIYTSQSPAVKAVHSYYLYTGKDYMLTELKIESDNQLASNYMSPLTMGGTASFLPDDNGTNAALIVPFDNDAWVRYTSNIFRSGSSYTSYEAGCFYSAQNQSGLVVGSIEHDNWKTGVVSKVNTPNEIASLTVFGGISDNYTGSTPTTRDRLPHGKVKGTSVKSPKVMIGYYADWRDGMEAYGELNNIVAPKRAWGKGTPFGWNSWGNCMANLSYAIASGVSAFFADYLAPEFSNDSTVYIGLDSYWTNITAQNRRRFINECRERGQKPGIYWTPFVDWSGNTEAYVEGTDNKYKYGDIMLKINGQPAKFPEGEKGWALDPTHPGTKMRIDYYIDQWLKDGYEFIKLDFMTHGTFEADSWYDSEITTGIQAYNQGMKYISDKIGDKMYINLSIAPLFPSQYANGRRYACDTYGAMSETQYALNALTHSWWTDRFYVCNDPDYMVFGRFEGNGSYPDGRTYKAYTLGENRARFTSVVTSGLCLLGDDFVNCSDEVRSRAQSIVKNVEINRIGKLGKSFRPVVNDAWGSGQADLFMHWVADTLYLAAYHFTSTPSQKTITVKYSDLNLNTNEVYTVHELWTDTKAVTESGAVELTLKVPRLDARIFKIYVDRGSSIDRVAVDNNSLRVYPNPCRDTLCVSGGSGGAMDYSLYSLLGQKVMDIPACTDYTIDVQGLKSGSYILVAMDHSTQERAAVNFIKE